jgi:hypothetical protein
MWVEELLNFLNSSSSLAQYQNVCRRKLGIISIQTVHILQNDSAVVPLHIRTNRGGYEKNNKNTT